MEIADVLEKVGVRGFTMWQDIAGRGSETGEPHLGDTTWPTMNSALLAVVEDEKCTPFMTALKELDAANPQLGLRAFWWEVGGTL